MQGTANKYWFETYGCQMNKAESEALKNQLDREGWKEAGAETEADLIVINTCSVRKTAENRVWGRIGYYKHQKIHRAFKLAVVGCMAERFKNEFIRKNDTVDIIIGNFQKHFLGEAASRSFLNGKKICITEESDYQFNHLHSHNRNNIYSFKAFVPIMHGCNNFCSYCVVPYLRGPEISRSPESIMDEISRLEGQGTREITLLGQNVNSYQFNNSHIVIKFPDLLKIIVKNIRSIKWIRFLTSHPKDLSDELIQAISEDVHFCRHIHLPVQHGSNHILKAMNRGYTIEEYKGLVHKIKKRIINVSLTTDILIGFPGETEEDFNQTMELMEEIGFNEAFTYRYNPREETSAYTLGNPVTEDVKLKRLNKIIELQKQITYNKKESRLGSTVTVLVEGVSKKNKHELLTRTEQNEMVIIPEDNHKIGQFYQVKLLFLKGNTYYAEEVK
jgi:tRNA-2-methylthio-N6-dimethylallyladenosine synthase